MEYLSRLKNARTNVTDFEITSRRVLNADPRSALKLITTQLAGGILDCSLENRKRRESRWRMKQLKSIQGGGRVAGGFGRFISHHRFNKCSIRQQPREPIFLLLIRIPAYRITTTHVVRVPASWPILL